jgi:lipoate-protein ligase A
VQSVRNFVTNIRDLLAEDLTIEELKQRLLYGIFDGSEIPTYDLNDGDWQQIEQIATERYRTWEWNYGRSPQFNIQKSDQLPIGKIDARIDVLEGHIQSIKIYGNFAGEREVAELEQQLQGVRYDKKALAEALANIDISRYFGELEKSVFLDWLY